METLVESYNDGLKSYVEEIKPEVKKEALTQDRNRAPRPQSSNQRPQGSNFDRNNQRARA